MLVAKEGKCMEVEALTRSDTADGSRKVNTGALTTGCSNVEVVVAMEFWGSGLS